ncbi:BarH protein [Sorangium cellulosum]|uniref:BarH protein n=1 Tax=Sorangium cellulosum TaxID=56 RepID=A0A150TDR6_SORCE|nr:BarH protein [Sorangium cellulosum]
MRDGHLIIDADRHVIEPIEMWREYLEPEFKDHAPYLQPVEPSEPVAERLARYGPKATIPLPPVPMLDGQSLWHKVSPRAQIELAWAAFCRPGHLAAAAAPDGQLRAMDNAGIDISFLYPTFATYLLGFDSLDPRLGIAFARAYNRWLRDFCSRDPERLRGVGLISPHDPASMIDELRRVAGFGWTAVVLRPNPVKGRLLGDPAYEPFWSTCEQLSVAVAIHEGTHARLPTAGADRFESRFALHACSHPMEQMMALLALIEGGVLERHPALRVAFLESGCGWVPYWLHRLDVVEYKHLSGEVAETVRRKPSEYFRRQCMVGLEPDEPYLPVLAEHIGVDNLLFGTDFPHLDHDDDIVDEALSLRRALPGESVRRILWDNPARFYAVPTGA